jgi:hypothetical protein
MVAATGAVAGRRRRGREERDQLSKQRQRHILNC